MLNRLVTLAIILAIAYLVVTRAGPWLQELFDASSEASRAAPAVDAALCIDRVSDANDALSEAARRFGRPPADVDAWTEAVWEIESAIQTASTACGCPSQSCRKASQALDEVRDLLSTVDELVRGQPRGFGNPARQQERINRLLDEARAAAGS